MKRVGSQSLSPQAPEPSREVLQAKFEAGLETLQKLRSESRDPPPSGMHSRVTGGPGGSSVESYARPSGQPAYAVRALSLEERAAVGEARAHRAWRKSPEARGDRLEETVSKMRSRSAQDRFSVLTRSTDELSRSDKNNIELELLWRLGST